MMLKKSIAIGIVTAQLLSALPGFCSEPGAPAQEGAAEVALLTRVLALRGEDLSTQDLMQQTQQAIRQYDESAPVQGREERLQDAMVGMGLYTAPQAAEILATADASAARLGNLSASTQLKAQQAAQAELTRVLQVMPEGAQFNACQDKARYVGHLGLGAFAVGCIGILAQGGSVSIGNWASVTALSGWTLWLIAVLDADGC